MFEGLTKRDWLIAAIGLVVAAGLVLEGTYFVLHTFVMDRPDPIYKQGGLKAEQEIGTGLGTAK